jgi:hypothetical protein
LKYQSSPTEESNESALTSCACRLVVGFVMPSFAQEQNAVDPEVRQQIGAAMARFDETWNSNDAAATVALFTQDAIEVWGVGEGPSSSFRAA